MKIRITTPVNQPLKEVYKGFDQNLFKRLSPPFPKVKVLQFDGSKTGGKVIVQLHFLLFKQVWESEIVEDEENEQEIYFIDKGTKLPFFLKYWQHKHLIKSDNQKTYIIDDIEYKTPFLLTDWLMYPAMYLQFLYRKPIYKKVFA